MADREGRLEDRPKRIKAELLPYDDCDIEALLNCLHETMFIKRYSVDGQFYIAILNWSKHQSPHVKEAPSDIPPPGEHHTSTVQAPCNNDTSTEEATLIPDSLNLIPKEHTCSPQAANEYSPDFLEFWKHYPKKKAKGAAWRAWKKIKAPKETLALIQVALAWQKKSKDWVKDGGQYIPHPATYLNAKGWEDETVTDSRFGESQTPEWL